MTLLIEKYPLLVQVIEASSGRPQLLIHSPDFGFSMGEDYNPKNVGQTEILIRRVREELQRRVKFKFNAGEEIPSPTLPGQYTSVIGANLLTTSEAAQLLRVSRQTLWRMSKSGKIRSSITAGGHRRFIRSDVEALLRNVG